ncbi:receptor homology region transmembrane domain ring H2 motif protein 1 [Wolffia australiana]
MKICCTPIEFFSRFFIHGSSLQLLPCLCCLISFLSLIRSSSGLVHFWGNSFSFTFIDAPARFAVPVDGSGICGALDVARPANACSTLESVTIMEGQAGRLRILLIARGSCSFEQKVRNAQAAGYKAAIVHDDQGKSNLISMVGEPEGISIPAVFVSKMAGEMLKTLAHSQGGQCCISPLTEEAAGTVLVISFVSLLVIVSVVATFIFARNCRPHRHRAHSQPASVSMQQLEALPHFTFKPDSHHKLMSETCAICLEDYRHGETLRALPCLHEFHTVCVDSWLLKWGTFCPVCKHEMSAGGCGA